MLIKRILVALLAAFAAVFLALPSPIFPESVTTLSWFVLCAFMMFGFEISRLRGKSAFILFAFALIPFAYLLAVGVIAPALVKLDEVEVVKFTRHVFDTDGEGVGAAIEYEVFIATVPFVLLLSWLIDMSILKKIKLSR